VSKQDFRDHTSRKLSEESGYDRLRSHGVSKDTARRTAREASEIQHKAYDRGDRRKE
jgi:hypothetical protein